MYPREIIQAKFCTPHKFHWMKSFMSLVLSSSEAELAIAQCVVVLIQILKRFLKWFILTSIVTTSLYYNKLGEDIHFSGFSYRIWRVLHWFSTSSPYCCLIFIVVTPYAYASLNWLQLFFEEKNWLQIDWLNWYNWTYSIKFIA